MKAEEVARVGVVGAGLMGSGIVEVCAKAGLQVTYVEADASRVDHGRSLVEGSLEKVVQRGKLDES
jgi:3-hydroxybutyryl-CoA dehydrogenase